MVVLMAFTPRSGLLEFAKRSSEKYLSHCLVLFKEQIIIMATLANGEKNESSVYFEEVYCVQEHKIKKAKIGRRIHKYWS